jgi:hypothetical protein
MNHKELVEGAKKMPGEARNDRGELIPICGEVLRRWQFLGNSSQFCNRRRALGWGMRRS